MPRKFFRRYLPDRDSIHANKYLGWMGGWLHHPNLWALNRHSVAGGFAIGLFAGMVPGPLQMLTAALLAVPLKKNIPVALLTTWYTNPLTIAPLYLLAYGYGRLLMGASGHHARTVEPIEWYWSDWIGSCKALLQWMISLGAPLAVGLLALAITLAVVGYFAVQLGWRIHTTLAWRARGRRRQEARAAKA
jgi:uncharacterized protein (DUF2062 family)